MDNIYFICPDLNEPSGGIKQLYRQVDILNANGFNAAILHKSPFYRCSWFPNSTKIVYSELVFNTINRNKTSSFIGKLKIYIRSLFSLLKLSSIKHKNQYITINNEDILVFPEIYGPYIADVLPNIKKVIYNQNCYLTFNEFKVTDHHNFPYTNEDTIATVVVSKDSEEYMNYVFPEIALYRIHIGIDNMIFNYQENKKKQIAYMPRKLNEDAIQIINILGQRGVLKGWDLIEINNISEQDVAKILKDTTFFLSFNHKEGFGLPPAEAMACGCIVIGYPGRGGEEYFNETFCYPIQDRDVQEFSKTLEKTINDYTNNPKSFIEKGRKASEFILAEYALEIEKNDVVRVWNAIENKFDHHN